jgi:N-acetylmuramoyl-L-alanine amidase
MSYSQINISSGHSINCQGASDIINEVSEARKVVDRIYEMCKAMGIEVYKYHDTSSSSSQNLANIANWHNRFKDGIDISIHFNCYQLTTNSMGTEVCYYSQSQLANQVSSAISRASGLKDRGGKERKGLYVLRHTNKPMLLIEVCFCDSSYDVQKYRENFDGICSAIIEALTGKVYMSRPVSVPNQNTNNNSNIGKIYRVQVGAYKIKSNAEEMQQKLKKLGIDSIIV